MESSRADGIENQSKSGNRAELKDEKKLPDSVHLLNNTLLPITQPTLPKAGQPIVYRVWFWEAVASVFSIICIAAIIGVLSYAQDRTLTEWQQRMGENISPTAVVSFLSTIGKSAALIVVAEIISQLKWLHFGSQPRTLVDLEIFDRASRGPWGAFMLILARSRSALLATSASILTIIALLVDPFTQLVFSFPAKLIPLVGASVQIAASTVYDPDPKDARWGICYGSSNVDFAMQTAIVLPIWSAARAQNLSCNYEKCEWPAITTLGVSSTCSNLTDSVIPRCAIAPDLTMGVRCNYTLPTINITFTAVFRMKGGASMMVSEMPLWNSTSLAPHFIPENATPAQIANFAFIQFDPLMDYKTYLNMGKLTASPPIMQAMQCSLHLSARTFQKSSYENFSATLPSGPETPLNVISVPGSLTGSVFVELQPSNSDHTSTDTIYRINYCDYLDLTRYLSDIFTVDYFSNGNQGDLRQIQTGSVDMSIGSALSRVANMDLLMRNISDSMTDTFRTSRGALTFDGTGWNTVTYISITWAWLSLPIFLVVAAFVMLVVLVVHDHSSDMPIWKSSSVPLLFYRLEGWEESELEVSGPKDLMEHIAKMTARVSNQGQARVFERY